MPVSLKLIIPIIVVVIVVIALVFILFPPAGGGGTGEQTPTESPTTTPPTTTPTATPTQEKPKPYSVKIIESKLVEKNISLVIEVAKARAQDVVKIINITIRELNDRVVAESIILTTSARRYPYSIPLSDQEYEQLFGTGGVAVITFVFNIDVNGEVMQEEISVELFATQTTRPGGPGPIIS